MCSTGALLALRAATRTRQPRRARARTTWVPMKPEPPNTVTRPGAKSAISDAPNAKPRPQTRPEIKSYARGLTEAAPPRNEKGGIPNDQSLLVGPADDLSVDPRQHRPALGTVGSGGGHPVDADGGEVAALADVERP